MNVQHILFLKLGALGDVLMTTPLVRQVRRAYPDAEITYCVGSRSAKAIASNTNIDHVRRFDETLYKPTALLRLLDFCFSLRRKRYDLVFVCDKHWIFNVTARLAGAPVRVGFDRLGKEGCFLTHRVHYQAIKHEASYYLDLAREYGIPVDDSDIGLDYAGDPNAARSVDAILSERHLRDFITIVNSGGSNIREASLVRRMPEHICRALVKTLCRDWAIVFVGSETERHYYDRLAASNSRCHNLAGTTDLSECAEILKRAELVISTDCGLLHLATAVGASTLAVFGPTHPTRKAPLATNGRVIWTDADIYDDAYELFGTQPTHNFFEHLRVDDILARVPEALETARGR